MDNVEIRVGGNPVQPDNDWSYMAPFSPSDVIEEYTRPARIVRNGSIVSLPALSERHRIDVEGTDGMDAFLTDGLRSVLTTIKATNMAEYTVRWPQHIDRWIAEGTLTSEDQLLERKFDSTRPEFTWMHVRCERNDAVQQWTVVDYGKDGNGSMARTTGLVTYALASLFATKDLNIVGFNQEFTLQKGSMKKHFITFLTFSGNTVCRFHNIGSSQCGQGIPGMNSPNRKPQSCRYSS